ncbi:hypothetical protein GYMLUDRAFT_68289 [Collybiopsis luxurians FD-317 M1]|nr:hypothetical protein GYMLUDRAFT_68289 [Collybiopsis luxurians FD-317 M1]
MPDHLNIILCGNSRSGKSSVVKMLSSTNTGEIVHQSLFQAERHRITLSSQLYCFYEITALHGGKVRGSESITHACVKELSQFVHELEDGISLLVFCLRAAEITDTARDNYDTFHRRICKAKIPIVLLVTGLENQEPEMEQWWHENSAFFKDRNMLFQGHACITATKGRKAGAGYKNQEEYDKSKDAVRHLIVTRAMEDGIHVPADTNFGIFQRAFNAAGKGGWPPFLKRFFRTISGSSCVGGDQKSIVSPPSKPLITPSNALMQQQHRRSPEGVSRNDAVPKSNLVLTTPSVDTSKTNCQAHTVMNAITSTEVNLIFRVRKTAQNFLSSQVELFIVHEMMKA